MAKPDASIRAFFTEDGGVLFECYGGSGRIEELRVLRSPTKPIADNDDDCPENCECRAPTNE